MKQIPMKSALAAAVLAAVATGCTTRSAIIQNGYGHAEVVSGFSQDDMEYVIDQAVYSILSQDRIKVRPDSNRAVLVIENTVNDTMSLGASAEALALNMGQRLRRDLTNKGRVVVYNPELGQYATVQVKPEYVLKSRLVQRNMRKDNGDYYKEFALDLTLIELDTGLEFWQETIPFRKVVDKKNLMY